MEHPVTRPAESFRVRGLLVHRWPGARPEAPVVLAVHGITSNGLAWGPVADHLDGAVTMLAPDLRGRAGSNALPGPYGLARHADDIMAVLDERGIDRVVLAGHSMGAYIAALAAVREPTRATRVIMVDGGLSFPLPAGTDVERVLAGLMGPALTRLEATFPTRDNYRQFWMAHPAFRFDWSAAVDAHLQHDLVGTGPFRSSCVADAVLTDGRDMLTGPAATAAIHALPAPGLLLYADRGLLDQTPGVYDARSLGGLTIAVERVPDTNHYSILLAAAGAAVVADRIRQAAVAPE